MRWFGGGAPGGLPVVPVGARVIWSKPALWAVGNWSSRHVRTADDGNKRLAVLGPCSADETELARALAVSDLATVAGAWAGSYTVVRTDERGAVEVVTDAAGACPVYTVNAPGGVMWGSSSLALSSLTGRSVDTDWLASYLLDKQAPAPDRSAWAGVTPVPAGHRLALSASGTVSLSPWWSPGKRRLDEARQTVRRALDEGVRVRVAGVPSSTDLAGMDSTTLTVLAARYGPIIGMTAYPSGVGEGGDLHYARALTIPGVTKTLFPLEARHLPFTPVDEPLPATDQPAPSAAVWAMFSAQLRAVAAEGAVGHLTGDGGDNLFLPSPTHLVDLARRGRLLRVIRDAQDWARLRRLSAGPLVWAALRGDTHRIARPWLVRPAWLVAPVPAPFRADGGANAVLTAAIRNVTRAAYADVQLADSLGIELHNPYFDGAVLDAVVSAPAWERFSARRYKPLLVDACGDLLPEEHRRRATKGVFAGDFHRGLRINLRRVLDLAGGRLAALGLIDPAPLRATVHAAALGAETIWASLLPTLGAEAWLEAVENAPVIEWTTQAQAGAR
ncbi:albusnodin/ikarugamycin family macrolactam cyclase [Streptomyces coffeae]|uniref:Albusnodin/ikarugamycin family macrolactam cyclase n=1 Tax=Streptomyces coffeae TaxID=621382 RepID=A0ABS1N5L0_9ACTN|nr:albusnodin/ikarugamycin family macrolactam cyclase [Streptomyces coffeae]MBL1095375.1 albusnodin/ikarugamycin family macrolactam cyclase [Streptomyces coffeae]